MVIDSLQEELQQKDRDLQELQKLKQFIEKYHPDWQKELEQQQKDKGEVQLRDILPHLYRWGRMSLLQRFSFF